MPVRLGPIEVNRLYQSVIPSLSRDPLSSVFFAHQVFVEGVFSGEGSPQRNPKTFDRLVLQNVTHRSGFGGAPNIFGFVVGRENQHNDCGELVPQFFRQLDAIRSAGQADVNDDRVRPQFADQLHARCGGPGFFAHLEFIAKIEQTLEPLADECVVLDKKNTFTLVAKHRNYLTRVASDVILQQPSCLPISKSIVFATMKKVGAIDSLASHSLTLSGLPVHVARLPPAPFTEPPKCQSGSDRLRSIAPTKMNGEIDSVGGYSSQYPSASALGKPFSWCEKSHQGRQNASFVLPDSNISDAYMIQASRRWASKRL